MTKRFYSLLGIFSILLLSPLFLYPEGSLHPLATKIFLVYPFAPLLSLVILYRKDWTALWEQLNLSKGKTTLWILLKTWLFWNALFYLGLVIAFILGIYSWDVELRGFSDWLSKYLNEYSNKNQVPIPIMPLNIKQMAQLAVGASVLLPIILFPFFFLQELVWRDWLPKQYPDSSLKNMLFLNAIWGLWQAPLIILGQIYSNIWLGIPAIIIASSIQGTLLSLVTRRTESLWAATIARAIIFTSYPLVIIFHSNDALSTDSLLIGLYGVFSLILMLGYIFWLNKITSKNAS